MRVYVAGSSKEPERVRAAMDALAAAGHEVAHDWLAVIEREGGANERLPPDVARQCARADMAGVRRADVFWLLAPDTDSIGAWIEYGCATEHRRIEDLAGAECYEIVISGGNPERTIFAVLSDEIFPTDADAIAWLRGVR